MTSPRLLAASIALLTVVSVWPCRLLAAEVVSGDTIPNSEESGEDFQPTHHSLFTP
jgi:hypothetical protein